MRHDDMGFMSGTESLDAPTFIAELAAEGPISAILPRLAGIDDGVSMRASLVIADGGRSISPRPIIELLRRREAATLAESEHRPPWP